MEEEGIYQRGKKKKWKERLRKESKMSVLNWMSNSIQVQNATQEI